MIYCEIGYHGTRRDCLDAILREGFRPSIGDKHWLGDGVYFFTELFYAYKWRYDACKAKTRRPDIPFVVDCCIVQAQIVTSNDRVFDMTKFEYYAEFQEWRLEIEQIMPRTDRAKNAVLDGVVLNYMFSYFGVKEYREKFDVVKAQFLFDSNGMHLTDLKLPKGIPQMQICVKNLIASSGEKTIQDVVEYSIEKKIKFFEAQRHQYETYKKPNGGYNNRRYQR